MMIIKKKKKLKKKRCATNQNAHLKGDSVVILSGHLLYDTDFGSRKRGASTLESAKSFYN